MITKKTPPRLKNYRSGAGESAIFEAIRRSLSTHKAKRILFDYDDGGHAVRISFSVEVRGKAYTFQLPARIDNVKALVQQSYLDAGRGRLGEEALIDQAYRTAWANIRDWVEAQMALIDTGMVKTEEVFLPYLVNSDGRTYFEAFEEQLKALPGPRPYRVSEVAE